MAQNIISFVINSKTKSIPIYKVLSNEGLIILEFIIIKNLKGITAPQFLIKSTIDSKEQLEPVFFKTEIVKPFNKGLMAETDSITICFLDYMPINCKKVKIELVVTNLESLGMETLLYANLNYKIFTGDNNDSVSAKPKNEIKNKKIVNQ